VHIVILLIINSNRVTDSIVVPHELYELCG